MFSNLKRNEVISALTAKEFDVLVIGGGITGSGIALDATTRGMKVALVDMQDFAAGTSSRSTKLVHGGLRYLKQFDVRLVAEVGKERAIVYENGPHVTKPERMLIPIHKGGTFGTLSTSIGLWVYDYLAGVKQTERRMMLSKEETLKKEPLINQEGLKGSGYYVEYRTDDARLTIEVLKAAVANGATALNYAMVDDLIKENGKVTGVSVVDQLTKETFKIKAKKTINATGPWVDLLREKDGSRQGKGLVLTKGVHIVLDQSTFPLQQAVYFDTKKDNRMIFAVPRDGKVYMGTTDTFYEEDPRVPKVTEADLEYLIEAIQYMFPDVRITKQAIESSWAGVRPLILEEGKDPSEISRKDEIWTSESGLMTIAGGKLTGYRKMAEMVVDQVATEFRAEEGRGFRPCQTRNLPISGGEFCGSENYEGFVQSMAEQGLDYGFTATEAEHLALLYGSNVSVVFELMGQHQEERRTYQIPMVLFAKLIYGIEYEMIVTPLDFYFRRTGDLLFKIDSVRDTMASVIDYMADRFQWSEEARARYTSALHAELDLRDPYKNNG